MTEGIRGKIDSINIRSIKEIPRDQLFFAGIIVVLAFFAWFAFYLIVYQVVSGVGIWAISTLMFLAFAISVGLSFFLLKPRLLAIATYLTISILGFIFFGWRGIEISAVLAFFTAMILGYKWVRLEQERLIPFWYTRLIRKGMPIFFTGLAFAIALFYSTSPVGRVSAAPQIPRAIVSVMLIPAEYALRAYMPDFRKDMKVSEIEGLDVGAFKSYFAQLPQDVRGKTVAEFSADLINTQLEASVLTYKQFLPVIYLFGLFIVFKAISTPFMWIAIGIGWIVMKILLYLKLLKLHKVGVEKEELTL